jgi:hypothetical protein
MQNDSNLLLVRIMVRIKSCLPIGWRAFLLFLYEKIRYRAALFWFGLRDIGILCSRSVIQRTIDVSPAFSDHGLAEKIAV